mmetsp:Transcript_671/g.1389  ORF Transcript_671/g.1389 Transcript_671/m.1389 type:complete len:275 (-) Transcript_671:47-871(-)
MSDSESTSRPVFVLYKILTSSNFPSSAVKDGGDRPRLTYHFMPSLYSYCCPSSSESTSNPVFSLYKAFTSSNFSSRADKDGGDPRLTSHWTPSLYSYFNSSTTFSKVCFASSDCRQGTLEEGEVTSIPRSMASISSRAGKSVHPLSCTSCREGVSGTSAELPDHWRRNAGLQPSASSGTSVEATEHWRRNVDLPPSTSIHGSGKAMYKGVDGAVLACDQGVTRTFLPAGLSDRQLMSKLCVPAAMLTTVEDTSTESLADASSATVPDIVPNQWG